MSRSAITIRNRTNAAKSTGPRSSAGKAAVAQNARRYGATARPDPERVASCMRIILDTPDLGPNDLLPGDARTRSALALVASEARLAEATRDLDKFEAGVAPPSDEERSIQEQIIEIRAMLEEMSMSARDRRTGLSLITRLQKAQIRETRPGGERHRLLKRYFREARAQRRRAFSGLAGLYCGSSAGTSGGEKNIQNPETKPECYLKLCTWLRNVQALIKLSNF